MDQQLTTEGETESSRHRVSTDQGGFVLPWFALMLLVLVAMAGFGVDVWNWWYTAQKTQRAADAGALAGVVFMPANFAGAAPSATSTALLAVNNNGYADSQTTIRQGINCAPVVCKPNQLQVSVTQTVNNSFTGLLGVSTTNVTRTATAEFNEPVKMGSPQAHIANDPEHPPVDQHWLNIGAPAVNKQTGDRYADLACSGAFGCTGGTNDDYLATTYVFTVEVPAGSPDIDLQVYDPEYANQGTVCDQNTGGLTPTNINGLMTGPFAAQFPASDDPLNRYAPGAGMWCPGDDNTNLGNPQNTAWLVRGPDPLGNPFQPLTNAVITTGGQGASGSCTKQFKGYNSDFYSLLNPASPTYDPDFYASYHRWYSLCHISGAAPGKYFIQVKSNLPLQSPPTVLNLENGATDPNAAGQNRYSIRVVNHGTNTYAPGVTVYAETHLPIYSNVLNNSNQTPQFYLARLLPGGGASGRILQLKFYDIGDVGGGTTSIKITPPAEMGGTPPTCTWTANAAQPMPTDGTINGCEVDGITSNVYPAGYNGTLINANIKVFGDYTCNTADPFGCWFRIQMFYTAGTQANDTTTWDATIGGDPVRLVQ